jgi:hypothetical protein
MFGPIQRSRDGWSDALVNLVRPAVALAVRGPDHQRQSLSSNDPLATWFELVARPLWGLAAHATGGGQAHDTWDQVRQALTAALNPTHRWYIGPPLDRDQRLVESAAVGYALAVAPHEMWDPLTGTQRDHLLSWLSTAAACTTHDNNWHFFPVLAATGVRAVDARTDDATVETHLDRIEAFTAGDGWYADGPGQQRDYYNAFGFHYYSLQLVALNALTADRAQRARQRAEAFAKSFQHWFADNGAALPFGRSMAYRFGQGAFWTALPAAGVQAVPWPTARGLAERHLAWWWNQHILDRDGLLDIGYAYPNTTVVEQYIGGGSAYWSTKLFSALAVRPTHPYWTAVPEQPRPTERIHVEPAAAMVLRRGRDGEVTALCGQEAYGWARGGTAKSAKFAYSTLAGFSVPVADDSLEGGAFDSSLALSDDGVHWRVRTSGSCVIRGKALVLVWHPWPDVQVRTTLAFDAGGHRRTHEITTGRALHTADMGFCVPWTAAAPPGGPTPTAGAMVVSGGALTSSLVDSRNGKRHARIVFPTPGSNVLYRRTATPALTVTLQPGRHVLRCHASVRLSTMDI